MQKRENINLLVKISPVIMGVKPAELLNVKKDCLKYCSAITNNFSSVNLMKIVSVEKYLAHRILFYHQECLQDILEKKENNKFLVSLGYPEKVDVNQYLQLLKNKQKKFIPHEIGIFLGYPLKDVLGFMNLYTFKPISNSKGWKYYGSRKLSEQKYVRFNKVREIFRELSNNEEFMGILSILIK